MWGLLNHKLTAVLDDEALEVVVDALAGEVEGGGVDSLINIILNCIDASNCSVTLNNDNRCL